jgi:ankyrin repeat protein
MTCARTLNTLFLTLSVGFSMSTQASEPAARDKCMVDAKGIPEPAVAYVARHYGSEKFEKPRVLALLDKYIAHGCPIDKADSKGMTALSVALVLEQPELVRHLLTAGADPKLRVAAGSAWAKGLDALGLAKAIHTRTPTDNNRLNVEILQEVISKR